MSDVADPGIGRLPDGSELRLLVASTLEAICQGVSDVQGSTQAKTVSGKVSAKFNPPDTVTFDIAVSAKRIAGVSGGLKLEIFSVGANAKGEKNAEHSTVSRIQFSVPYTKYMVLE